MPYSFDESYSLNQYQTDATELATYPNVSFNMVYPAMGLAGEAGEACDKVKKFWRNTGDMSDLEATEEWRLELAKEIGDVLWYASALAKEIGMTLGEVAEINITKLRDRHARGVLKSEGDNR
jgi:NTP pyrophosphatase (non-canonical NTP hydrolase)